MVSLHFNTAYLGQSESAVAVLGHYPAYRETADKQSLSYFCLGGTAADELNDEECWRLNRAFLDRIIAARQPVMLATPVGRHHPASWYARELGYLEGRGYQLTANGSMMLPSPEI